MGTLKYEEKKKGCGDIEVELITTQSFLTHEVKEQSVTMTSDLTKTENTFSDSKL